MSRNIKLILFRHNINKTQCEMAKILGVSNSYYSKIELGTRNPSFNFVKKFKEEFEVNIDKFFFENQRHVKCSEQTA